MLVLSDEEIIQTNGTSATTVRASSRPYLRMESAILPALRLT